MSTIYEIQKLPGDSDERPFIIAQNSKERVRCRSAKFCCLFYGAFLSTFGLRSSFQKCSLLAEIKMEGALACI
jgi:hypothetical protein